MSKAVDMPQPGQGQTLTDEQYDSRALQGFSEMMRFKLARAREKGRGGWRNPEVCTVEWLWERMREHSLKENLDMVDVANFALMITYRCANVPGDYERLAAHVAATRAQLTEQQELEQRWIPVSERLPEVGQNILFTAETTVRCGFLVNSAWYHMTGRTYDASSVTHWQPLPAPPAPARAGGE